ncbi:hypothetical protein SARC_07272 [Sphaeroforma arctica JP610]|uniref:RWD domain-containing protein n=1 Tax=Sphaeroforma arctica JP610 TaxID=667725 RepID=A0A0L0FU66_9EUKA|nr:hypothetical protein SARC_07272 [Sphaeroforma arctica JP610]KNC80372.1 hypothetical protein SARC_07272 [Sphaeroforma arctica JP610]|eukprot:XP_014154274.1 hypothetical protein SARC_07272 [Sphaeroforma arctica JP610]
MTDYQETQLEELEVLESIFPEEYKELTREPTVTFEITLKPDEGTEKSEELTLAFELPPTYPDVAPEITTSSAKIQPQLLNKLKRELDEMALENIGDVMVFVIASHAKEWLDTRMDGVLEEVQSQKHGGRAQETKGVYI